MTKVFIDGKEGTTGLKLFERFACRKDVELLEISDDMRKDSAERAKLINSSDVTFLCLPDAAAVEAVELCKNDNVKIIDASTAHRTCEGWAYGFPELDENLRKKIQTSNRIAVPGCHASGFLSIVYPLVKAKVIDANYPLVCHSLTGYSGGGKKMIAEYEATERGAEYDAPRQYALSQTHKHQKEMKAVAGLQRTPIFNPIVADFERGMEVSVPLYCDLVKKSAKEIHEILATHYANQKLVKVMPFGGEGIGSFLSANKLSGRNDMEIYVFGNEERVLICSVFDNLGKGASGAAVQCMNIALRLDETLGLI